MNRALATGVPAERAAHLPPRLAELIRPELPSLAEEIVAEIRRAIPEYARPLDGPYGHVLRLGVERSLAVFTERIAAPSGSPAGEDSAGTARMLGQYEAHEGRSMDSLQAAYRIGGQVAWRRVMKVAPRHDISSAVLSRLADALLAYMDELAAQSLDGYLHARARPILALDERRRRLLRLLLAAPGPDGADHDADGGLRGAADGAGWPLPDAVTLVAVEPDAHCVWTALDEDVLAELECPEPHLLLPGPFTPERRAMLGEALPDRRIAVGLAMPVGQAADSLRWARQALGLALDGVLDGPVTLCEENLVTLWLLSDPALVEQLTRRRLGVLDDMTPGQQDRLTETLRTWLVTRGTAAEIAEQLHIHPQTVRYRMRKIEQTLGDALADPEARFGIEVALRAAHLRSRRPAPAPHRPAAGRRTPARPPHLRHLR
ncbi:helix-turn-helix domain-containing protein [Actinomadura mexicana]|uniref:PucR C-terminal helix-turn-helix domain-containing protein n=1 Tax=Actinomadura mexicana TaxID=134959 RepID=A0A239CUW9_9ACTN|nr:helix-turn-helix domain-containing protein [Actinomadura mexicana]SNS23900.1 PucR C-terminal helix-turn-helix domain-containing protein [Actinomadura mexicana]